MTESDVLYRALGELYKALSADTSTSKFMDEICKAPEPESVTVTHNVCHVDTDWITEIEHGLVFIGKAIDENRQFIRSDGEVKPIEKVKHISKESVQHLSRHSDLITREQKEDIVPDKLYTVEKESDYAVYENKFLFLLLNRIQDFVSVRYEAIINAYKEYLGEFEVTKTIKSANRTMSFTFKLSDEQRDVMLASADDECAKAIERMDNILHSVAFYLKTPIMQEVMHKDKISGNITKTNVLLMNKNFFGAMQLYEYLLAYEEDGYTIEKCVDAPEFSDTVKRELAIPAMLYAFIVYEHGLGLEKYLRSEREKEDLRLAEEAQKELLKKLKALKKRLERTGESMDEYVLMLEQRNAILENSYKLLQAAQKDIEDLKLAISRLHSEIEVLEKQIRELNDEKEQLVEQMRLAEEAHKRELEETKQNYEAQISLLKAAHAEELAALRAENAEKLAKQKAEFMTALAEEKQRAEERYSLLKKQCDDKVSALNDAHKKAMDKLVAEQKSRLDAMKAEHDSEKERITSDFEKRIAALTAKANDSAGRAQNASEELQKLQKRFVLTSKERDVLAARLTALRSEYGLLTEADDFTTEEGFTALEHEFEVLGRLLSDEWKNVKVMLKNEILGQKHPSARKKHKKSKEYLELKEFKEQRDGQGASMDDDAEGYAQADSQTDGRADGQASNELSEGSPTEDDADGDGQ